MPPIKKLKPNEDELVALIKEKLIGHEEAYVPGSWEDFNKKEEQKRGLVFWIGSLSGIAAVLLAGVAFYFAMDTGSVGIMDQTRQVKQSKKTETALAPDRQERSTQSGHSGALPVQDEVLQALVIDENTPAEQVAVVSLPGSLNLKEPGIKESLEIQSPVVLQQIAGQPNAEREDKKPTILDFLENESKINRSSSAAIKKENKRDNKWAMGIVVAPSIGNAKKLNMGYGVSMEYALSNKVSVNSGISYGEMSSSRNTGAAGRTMSAPTTSSIVSDDVKRLQSTDARITGIDIPLEFKYNLNKNFYANVGVSAFAVLDQKQSNNYIQTKLQSQDALPGSNGFSSFLVNERVSEKVPESEIKDPKYLGFYNFSFGYRQKLSKNNSFSVEPFMKLPMREASTENLSLIGTGLRLKLDF